MSVKPNIATLTNTTAGTRTQVNSSVTQVTSVYFEALSTNTGVIYIGDSTVTSTKYMTRLAVSAGFNLSAGGNFGGFGAEINLSTLYIDSSVSGDKVQVTFLTRVGTGL